MKWRLPLAFITLTCIGAASVLPVRAQEAPAEIKDWSFAVTPYVWAAGLEGTAGAFPNGPPLDVDVGFGDILRNLDIAAMTDLELRYRRWGVFADIVYTSISADIDTPFGLVYDGIDAKNQIFAGTFEGAYRLLQGERGFLDVMAGARLWSINTELEANGGLLADRSADHRETWVDPIIGIKGRFIIGDGFYLNTMAHVGGFGAGSDLTWDTFGGIGYQFNDMTSAVAGYRHLEVDYSRGGFIFDVEMSGPAIGMTIRF